MKRQSGITLIALVITIIVLLILAGVSISAITGENGIVQKAKEASEKTEVAEKEEEEMLQDALDYIDSNVSGDKFTVGTIVTENNRTLTGGEPSYKNPIIPVGFKAVNDGASWEISGDEITGWNDGLVIEDEKSNQFVWVPVDGTKISYKKWCVMGISYVDTMGDDTIAGVNENDQITKYGGFWIGRYEAGRSDVDIPTSSTNDVSEGIELLIQKGAQPWNFISYENAKKVAEGYVNNSNVKSGLLTGTQWDTTMSWIVSAGYNVASDSISWGNYQNNISVAGTGRYAKYEDDMFVWQTGEFSKTESSAIFTGTGLYEDAKTKNIYDLAGNMSEMTAEWDLSGSMVMERGSDANTTTVIKSASYRNTCSMGADWSSVGFRVVLFVM